MRHYPKTKRRKAYLKGLETRIGRIEAHARVECMLPMLSNDEIAIMTYAEITKAVALRAKWLRDNQ